MTAESAPWTMKQQVRSESVAQRSHSRSPSSTTILSLSIPFPVRAGKPVAVTVCPMRIESSVQPVRRQR